MIYLYGLQKVGRTPLSSLPNINTAVDSRVVLLPLWLRNMNEFFA